MHPHVLWVTVGFLSFAQVTAGADTTVSMSTDSVRGGKTYSTGSNQAVPSDANGNSDSIFISGGSSLIVTGLDKPYDRTSVTWEVIDRYMFNHEGWSDSYEVCAYHGSVCYSRDKCEPKGNGLMCSGDSCSKSIFDMPYGEYGCEQDVSWETSLGTSGWGGGSDSRLKITCNDSEGCRFMVFVRLWEYNSPPPPSPPPSPPPPPPSADTTSNNKLDVQTGTVLYRSSKPTGSGCATSNTACSCSIEYTVLKISSSKYQFTSNFDPSSEPSCASGYQCYVLEIEGTLNDDGSVLTGNAKVGSQDVGVASFAVTGTGTYKTFLNSCTYTYSTTKTSATSGASAISITSLFFMIATLNVLVVP